MTTLQEAREASKKLNELQKAASQLPALERLAALNQSGARLEAERDKAQAAFDHEYKNYQRLGAIYVDAFRQTLNHIDKTVSALKQFLASRHALSLIIDTYSGQALQHELAANNDADIYRDAYNLEQLHANDLNLRPFDHNPEPQTPKAGVLYRLLLNLLK